jgi:hypothetical protein
MALSMIERMRQRTASVAATTTIAVAEPIKAIGGEGSDKTGWVGPWVDYLLALERHPDKRGDLLETFSRKTGIVLA